MASPNSPRSPHSPLLSLPNYYSEKHQMRPSPGMAGDLWRRLRRGVRQQLHGFGGKRMVFMLCALALIVTTWTLRSPSVHVPTFLSFCAPSTTSVAIPANHLNPLPLDASLAERLAAWRSAPGTAGWEGSNFVRWNLETCSGFHLNQNKDLTVKSSVIWAQLNSSTIWDIRNRMASFLERHQLDGSFDTVPVKRGGKGLVGEGRGIVFTAGNADTLSRVVVTLRFLRKHLHSTLPAAVYHFPSERPAADSGLVEELAGLNAKLVEANGTVRDESRQKNYHLKAMAIVECEWAEVVYIDSDNIPAADPEILFDAPNYKRLGSMFWPDYWKTSPVNPIWQILGVQCRDEWEQEAGQIVVDKRRHLDAMLLSLYMLIDWKFWYYFSDGDKDVFRFAFLALRKRWALPGRWVGGGALPHDSPTGFCSHTMMQYDHAGAPMFVHYNLLKQIPSGVYREFTWGRTKQLIAYPTPPNEPLPVDPSSSTRWQAPYSDPTVRGADDVEADMLANADDDGHAIQPATDEVRRRAALERGIHVFFHGGGWSAFCIDVEWKGHELGLNSTNELGIDWKNDPLQIVQWIWEDRLKTFEDYVYDQGFEPSGKGF